MSYYTVLPWKLEEQFTLLLCDMPYLSRALIGTEEWIHFKANKKAKRAQKRNRKLTEKANHDS